MRRTLAFIGDVMLGRGVSRELPRHPPEYFWGNTLPILRSADAVIANLECAITARTERWWKTPKVFYFGADPLAVDVLKIANIRAVSLANNHTLDFREEGLLDTLHYLDLAGIAHAGAGRNLADAMAPAVIDVNGLQIGVVSATDNEPPFAAGPERPGTFHVPVDARPEVVRPVSEAMHDARARGAHLVVLAMHWGPNMVTCPTDEFCTFAHAAADRGADILFGHSAHLFQGVQRRDGRLILYDTGDFLDDYAVDPILRNDWSFIFLIELEETPLTRLRMIPVKLDYAQVNLATGMEFEHVIERMTSLCAELGTAVTRTSEGLELGLTNPEGAKREETKE